jgi:hypothetical protein
MPKNNLVLILIWIWALGVSITGVILVSYGLLLYSIPLLALGIIVMISLLVTTVRINKKDKVVK